jgi:hypothetical protein
VRADLDGGGRVVQVDMQAIPYAEVTFDTIIAKTSSSMSLTIVKRFLSSIEFYSTAVALYFQRPSSRHGQKHTRIH